MFIRCKGYLTIESSFVFSIIIILYYFMVIGSFTLFSRCFQSQKEYILNMNEARITNESDENREVIYDDAPYENMMIEGGVWRINPLILIMEDGNGY